MKFTDSHCHLDFDEFSAQRAELLQQCFSQNIHRIIIPSVSSTSWQAIEDLAKSSASEHTTKLYSAVGIHPWYVEQAKNNDLKHLAKFLVQKSTNVVAIGETGLDANKPEMAKQIDYFEQHLQLAQHFNLPAIIHHHRSHHLIIPLLKKMNLSKGGVVHAFSGSYQQAMAYIELGFKLGIGGTITYPRAIKTRETVAKLPLSAILLETDAPAMPIMGQQGKTNSPLNLMAIFNSLLSLRDESAEQLAKQIEQNVNALFFSV